MPKLRTYTICASPSSHLITHAYVSMLEIILMIHIIRSPSRERRGGETLAANPRAPSPHLSPRRRRLARKGEALSASAAAGPVFPCSDGGWRGPARSSGGVALTMGAAAGGGAGAWLRGRRAGDGHGAGSEGLPVGPLRGI